MFECDEAVHTRYMRTQEPEWLGSVASRSIRAVLVAMIADEEPSRRKERS
jgi:hypothetical protein